MTKILLYTGLALIIAAFWLDPELTTAARVGLSGTTLLFMGVFRFIEEDL